MAIDAPCGACGQDHRLGDHVAGKRFRCKGCGQAVTAPDLPTPRDFVPVPRSRRAESPPDPRRRPESSETPNAPPRAKPRTAEPTLAPRTLKPRPPGQTPTPAKRSSTPRETAEAGVGDPWDDLGDQGELIEEADESPTPVPKKKKKVKAKSAGGGAGVAAGGMAGGGLLLACLLIRLVLKLAPGLPGGLIGGMLAGNANWRVWNHPTAQFQVELPNAPQSQWQAGVQIFMAPVGNRYACGLMDAPLPPQAVGVPDAMLGEQFSSIGQAISGPKAHLTSRRRVDVQGCPGVEFVGKSDGKDTVARVFIRNQRILMMMFAYDGTDYPEERARFFNSLRLQ